MNNSLIKKFLSFSYGSLIGAIFGVLSTMITTRILNPEDFGKASMFNLALNVSMIFIIFGTDQAFVRFFYEEKEENRGGLLQNCLKIPFIMTISTISIIIFFHKQISFFLFDDNLPIILIALVFGIVFSVLYRYGMLVIRMEQNGHLFSRIQITDKVLRLLIILILYSILGRSYHIIIYSTVITLFILSFISIKSKKDYWKIIRVSDKKLIHSKKDIFKYSYPLVLTTLITWLFQSFDKIAIKGWSSFEELGLYAAAFKIIALISILQIAFTTFWTPVCYEHYEKNSEDKSFFEYMARLVTFMMFLVAIVSIAGKDIIINLLGNNYAEAANIMPFLVFIPVMYTISETTVIGINFYKKPKWHMLISVTVCIINIIGNYILVPKYGAVGASISTAFSYVLFFSLRTMISLKYYKVNYGIKKLYFFIIIIASYAGYSIINTNKMANFFVGLLLITFLIIMYFKDLKMLVPASFIKKAMKKK